jgi:hypothetical protein
MKPRLCPSEPAQSLTSCKSTMLPGRALEMLGDWPQVLSVIDGELQPEDGDASQDQDMEQGPEDERLFGNALHLLRCWCDPCPPI